MHRPDPPRRNLPRYGTIPEDREAELDQPCPLDEEGYPMYCWAKKRQDTGRCHRPAGWRTPHLGAGHCRLHGGNMPNNIMSARKEIARREVHRLGISLNMSPQDALLATVRQVAGTVAFLTRKVAEIDPEDLAVGGPGAPWYALLREAQKDLTTVSAAASRAGVEERRIQLAETDSRLLVSVVRGMMEDLGIVETPETLAVVRRHMLKAAASVEEDGDGEHYFGDDVEVMEGDFEEAESKMDRGVIDVVGRDVTDDATPDEEDEETTPDEEENEE